MSISEKYIKQIIILYKKGITIRMIEELTGCSQSTIMRLLKDRVKMRGEHCLRINRAKLKNLPSDYLKGELTVKELMKKYSIGSEQTLYRILNEFKTPLKR